MAQIQPITKTFVDNVTVIDAAFLNGLVTAVNALIAAHNDPDIKVETGEHYLSISDAQGNEIVRLNNNLEVKANGDLYVAGEKIQ